MASVRSPVPAAALRARGLKGAVRTLHKAVLEGLREVSGQLGGASGLTALGAVAGVGLWLGAYPPEAVLPIEEAVFGTRLLLDQEMDIAGAITGLAMEAGE